jgi:spore maturation protein CgeB
MALQIVDLFPSEHVEQYELSVVEQRENAAVERILRARREQGWTPLESGRSPAREAEKLLLRALSAADEDSQHSALVLGAGSGYVARRLDQVGIRRALMVGGSRAAAERHAALGVQCECDATLVVGDDIERIWAYVEAFARQGPFFVALHPRESRVDWGLFSALLMRLERWRSTASGMARPSREAQRSAGVRRVLFFGAGGLMEKELLRVLARRDIAVELMPPIAERRMDAKAAWRLIEAARPDLVLSTNNQGLDPHGYLPQACALADATWATWYLDDPRFLLQAQQQAALGENALAFCWDNNGIDAWREIGQVHAYPLPLCTDPNQFFPGEGDASLAGRLVFVGSARFARAPGFFSMLDRDAKALEVLEALSATVLATRRAPSLRKLQTVLQDLGLVDHFDAESRRRLPAYVVQETSRQYRIDALRAVAELRPVVFGNGWEGLLPKTVELRPPVDYDKRLPTIYRSDALHLALTNLQMRSYPNQRPFDVGASGQAVLQDRLDGWQALFGRELEALVFDDLEQLRTRAEQLLEDAPQKAALAATLRERVLAEHTYDNRLDSLLEAVGDPKSTRRALTER